MERKKFTLHIIDGGIIDQNESVESRLQRVRKCMERLYGFHLLSIEETKETAAVVTMQPPPD